MKIECQGLQKRTCAYLCLFLPICAKICSFPLHGCAPHCLRCPLVGGRYLNIPNIVAAAVSHNCTMLHPGYGFLAENATFVEICGDHGLNFIGPKVKKEARGSENCISSVVMRRWKRSMSEWHFLSFCPTTSALPQPVQNQQHTPE